MSISEKNTKLNSPSLLTSLENEENTKLNSPSLLTSLEDEENAQVYIARKEFTKVVLKYLSFLHVIAITLTKMKDDENQKKREKRKFLAIKKELRNFLIAHIKFYEMYEIYVKTENCSKVFKKRFSIIDHGNDFLKLEDFF